MSVTVEAIEKRDGRRERAVASRARILEAMVDLIQAGEVQPSAEAVAVRAGVGVRTVFRLFNDVEGLHRGLQQVMDERLARSTTSRSAEPWPSVSTSWSRAAPWCSKSSPGPRPSPTPTVPARPA
ncbi:hypothetical protein LJR164_000122 [Phenylobacterium sp. LjRoot164]|uniref:hypothetical protein n=1 Tax=unclassified Phenylobacterium TaxID=2640670 RepID=UPI003ECC9BDB